MDQLVIALKHMLRRSYSSTTSKPTPHHLPFLPFFSLKPNSLLISLLTLFIIIFTWLPLSSLLFYVVARRFHGFSNVFLRELDRWLRSEEMWTWIVIVQRQLFDHVLHFGQRILFGILQNVRYIYKDDLRRQNNEIGPS